MNEHNKIILWGRHDVAPAPQWMVDEVSSLVEYEKHTTVCMNSNFGDDYKYRDLYKDGKTYKTAFNNCRYLTQQAYKWVLDNISSRAKDVRMSFTVPGLERAGPHVDSTRDYTLMYVLKNGGKDNETVFWKEKGVNELIRPYRYTVNDYDNVERIGSISLPLNTWILLNARVLHSVENINEGRISIQCAFDDISELKFSESCWI
jgi:hypothetical protein